MRGERVAERRSWQRPRTERLGAFVLGLVAVGATGAAWAAGGFADAEPYPVAASPQFIADGDFDGDGRTDLAVSTCPGGESLVSILLGKRHGGFQDSFDETGHDCGGVIVARRFDGDRKIDLVAAEQNVGDIAFLKGKGNGHFADPVVSDPDLFSGSGLAAGDFNRDGKLDVAMSDYLGAVGISLGDGHGEFGPAKPYETDAKPAGVIARDLDRDGRVDLATANEDGNSVSVLKGRRGGKFATQTSYLAGSHPYGLASADFNEDRRPDLVASTRIGTEGVDVLIQKANGSFKPGVPVGTGGDSLAVVTTDVNRDGHSDVAFTKASPNPNVVSVLRGRGDGTFRPQDDLSLEDGGSVGLVAKGFDADRRPDLAVAMGVGSISILLNQP